MAVAETEEKSDPSCILALDWLLSASILCQGRQLQLPQQLVRRSCMAQDSTCCATRGSLTRS